MAIEMLKRYAKEESKSLLAKSSLILLSENKINEIERVSNDPVFRKQLLEEYALA